MYNETIRAQKEVILCEDGTNTLYSKEFNESYHSPKDGALNESLQKHVLPAFDLQQEKTELTILDICYGLGYNTLATLYHVKTNNLPVKLHILSPEFDEALVRSLKEFNYPSEFDILQPVIQAISNDFYYEDEQFKIEVMIGDARQLLSNLSAQRSSLNANDIACDIIYQDAFSPKVNPLLWTREWFADIKAVSADDAVLTTYSTAAATRMGLHENGFELHYFDAPHTRRSLIASPRKIGGLEWIDMELKKQRNPEGKSLKDKDFQ
jgi:tRNA U34 5-methylaminomethyl-2-thiouridine-forming methyltransferase MnmC